MNCFDACLPLKIYFSLYSFKLTSSQCSSEFKLFWSLFVRPPAFLFYDSNFFITSGPISSKLGKNHLQVKYLSKMKNHTFFERKVIRIFFLNVDIFQNIFLSRKWCITVYTGIGRILSKYVRYWKKLPELDI